MKRSRCYESDRERLDALIASRPRYRHHLLSLQDVKGDKRALRRACAQRGVDCRAFLETSEFEDALQARDERCALCLEAFRYREDLVLLLCGHDFHFKCMKDAMHAEYNTTRQMPRCPLCRAPFK